VPGPAEHGVQNKEHGIQYNGKPYIRVCKLRGPIGLEGSSAATAYTLASRHNHSNHACTSSGLLFIIHTAQLRITQTTINIHHVRSTRTETFVRVTLFISAVCLGQGGTRAREIRAFRIRYDTTDATVDLAVWCNSMPRMPHESYTVSRIISTLYVLWRSYQRL
jgi:hypothetical protein